MNNSNNYCIILAGGIGRRLWPCSRKQHPKQFLDFFGTGRTLLQATFDRYAKFIPLENIYISTFGEYVNLTKEQLPEISETQIIAEPVQLSTAPAAAWTSEIIRTRYGKVNIILTPADQHIVNEQRFEEQILTALNHAQSHPEFVVLGIKPTTPNTGYGYIQMGEQKGNNLASVQSFTEKPDLHFAEMFVQSGEFLWNSGLFVCNTETMHKMLENEIPQLSDIFNSASSPLSIEQEKQLAQQHYPALTHQALDLLLLEKTSNISVMACDFGWADVGAWTELHEVEDKDTNYNAVITPTKVLFDNAAGNLVCLPDAKVAVISELEGYLIAEKDGVLVICPNGDSSMVRRLMTEAQIKLGEEFV